MNRLAATFLLAGALAITAGSLRLEAQTTSESLEPILKPTLQPSAVTAFQLQKYLVKRIPHLPHPATPEEWGAETQKLRKHMLEDIAFHGWPHEWVESTPNFKEISVADSGNGYRLHKLRYEIVPGFESTALLYEPGVLSGRVPAILNVNGHDPQGKAAEYKQKRCINFAKRGVLALSLEWPGFGELSLPENSHDFGAHLDLAGANALGFFYLAMRRGLDYLATLPHADPARLGVSGLSGGGWQTIVLSALDDRVAVAVEVAGFGSLESNLTHPVDTDEIEENPTDFTVGEDYTYLVAMRAPRPTLLIHNAEDDCCFRAGLVKPYIYDQTKVFFRLFGNDDRLAWHENTDPSTHNYQLDNRQQTYGFFAKHFGLSSASNEIPSDAEIGTLEELKVGVPADNLTILGLARKIARGLTRPPLPEPPAERATWAAAERLQLQSILRYKPVTVENAWRLWNTKSKGVQSLSYRFDFSDGLSAAGVWVKAIATPASAPATLVLNDKGKKAAGQTVSERVNRGEQVLALEPLFNGETIPQEPDPTDWEGLTATLGDRPLGIQAAQLLAVLHWWKAANGNSTVRLETNGIRTQILGLAAVALEPANFREIVSTQGMRSLSYLFDAPVPWRSAPELFCLDLYKEFDVDRLTAMAAPARVAAVKYIEDTAHK
jgi:hypothetical protein